MHLLGKAHARKVAKASQPPTVTSSAETGNVTSSADTVAVAATGILLKQYFLWRLFLK